MNVHMSEKELISVVGFTSVSIALFSCTHPFGKESPSCYFQLVLSSP